MSTTTQSTESIRQRLEEVRARITAAALRAGRDPKDVTLVAVSKTHPADIVREAIAAGVVDLGENKVQEAEEKIPQIDDSHIRWHLIGHLQSNKARKAVALFQTIHSVDSVSLVRRLDRNCGEQGRKELPILIQVDLAEEETKTGVGETELPKLVAAVKDCRYVKLLGLMTLPPFLENPEEVRPYFRRLRHLRDDLAAQEAFSDQRGQLSMGMTHDFEVAIEEGATIIRVGTAIFGARDYSMTR